MKVKNRFLLYYVLMFLITTAIALVTFVGLSMLSGLLEDSLVKNRYTAESLMKGSLHTDELMGAVVAAATGLRTGRRVSHVFVMDVPAYPRLLLLTDAAINIAPTIKDKRDIAQNAGLNWETLGATLKNEGRLHLETY